MQNSVTLKNIALQLGVSISTVSKALNDSYEISTKTKKRIISTANKLNYKPNFYAKNLKKREKFIFGVILPNLKDDFYLDILTGITEESFNSGHLIMVYQTSNKIENEVKYTQLLSEDIIDGLILCSTFKKSKNECLQELLNRQLLPIEVVENNQDIHSKLTNEVSVKGIEVGKLLVNRIIQKVNN